METQIKSKFWRIAAKFYDWNKRNYPTMSVLEMAEAFNIKLTDGFFYNKVIPILIEEGILEEMGEKKIYKGRPPMYYKIDKDILDDFFISKNFLANRLYKRWIVDRGLEGL